jgi:hypothetical protein
MSIYPVPSGKDWSGGFVVLSATAGGWSFEHHPKSGGIYPVDWHKRKTVALEMAKARAREFGAKLYEELHL